MIYKDFSGLESDSIANEDELNIMVVELVVCALGVIANLTVILVIFILREYRKTLTHWYILQLAIADSAFLLTIPLDYAEAVNGGWIYSNGMCKAKETILFLNYHSSILFLVVMSLDRYIAVCLSRSDIQSKLRTRKVSIIATIVVWGLSLIFCIPIMMYSTKILSSAENATCGCGYLFPPDFHSLCTRRNVSMHAETFNTSDACPDILRREIARMQDVCVSGNIQNLTDDYPYDYHYDYGSGGSGEEVSGNGTLVDTEYYYNLQELPPIGIELESNQVQNTTNTCNYNHQGPGWFTYLRFLFIGMFIIPMLIITYCYVSIIRQLRRNKIRQTIVKTEDKRSSTRRSYRKRLHSSEKANKKIARVNITCILLVTTFIACWLPFHSYHMAMMHGIHASAKFCNNMLHGTSLLIFLNSALNPLMYNFIGTKFGDRVRKAAVRLKSSVRRTSVSSSRGVRYNRRQTSSRGSSHGVTINTAANRSLSSSIGPRSGANWSMVAMPGSIADPEQTNIPVGSTAPEAQEAAKPLL